eukprot:scaffold7783_cov85-Skeletonema_dohrnii-CCMP3373.AAC.6
MAIFHTEMLSGHSTLDGHQTSLRAKITKSTRERQIRSEMCRNDLPPAGRNTHTRTEGESNKDTVTLTLLGRYEHQLGLLIVCERVMLELEAMVTYHFIFLTELLYSWGYDVEMKGTIMQYLEDHIEARVQ